MFKVRVADNFHYMDDDETYTHGEFATWGEAVAAARKIVERCLQDSFRPDTCAAALFQDYVAFGDDPYIVPVPAGERFSAREYAKQHSEVLCAAADIALLKAQLQAANSLVCELQSTISKQESQLEKLVKPSPPPSEERRSPDGKVVWTPNSPHALSPEQWARVLQEDANQQQYRKDWAAADKLLELPPGAVSQ